MSFTMVYPIWCGPPSVESKPRPSSAALAVATAAAVAVPRPDLAL